MRDAALALLRWRIGLELEQRLTLAGLVGVMAVCLFGGLGWMSKARRGLPRPSQFAARHSSGDGARFARSADIRELLVGRRPGARVVLGELRGPLGRRRLVATEARHSVLVVGPTQSGKTSGLAIPAILRWPGPVVATSVKDDLTAATWRWRSQVGPCWLFAPTLGSLGSDSAPTVELQARRWSPLGRCRTWGEAQKMATWLVEATPAREGLSDAGFWYSAAARQLAPLMLAAACGRVGMAEVASWNQGEDFETPLAILSTAGHLEAWEALAACARREDRIRSSITTTLETVLAPFCDPAVAAATSCCDFDPDQLLAGAATLYLSGPSHDQSRVQGLFASLLAALLGSAVERAARLGGTLDPPLLVVLDEAANIAPVQHLDTLASTAAAMGIALVTICQDLAQLSARYGQQRCRTVVNNHRAKLILSGVSDLATLDLVSGLAGERSVRQLSWNQDLRSGARTRQSTTVYRRLAPTDQLRRITPGWAVAIYGHYPPMLLRLRPWFEEPSLRSLGDSGSSKQP